MSLKLVKETVDVTNIAEQIRSGVWKNTKKFNTDLFVKEVAPKQFRGVMFDSLPHYHIMPKKGERIVFVITFK